MAPGGEQSGDLPFRSHSDDELIAAALHQEFGQGAPAAGAPALPRHIGPYRILRRIGSGGMGVVYEAEQTEPTRRVALKVTRSPAGTEGRQFRLFRREIEALARLKHPSIARIYDAGQTSEGQQYFVMELIEGQPLIEYCDGAGLSLPKRLALFVQVCRAVNYAHQRSVIHRDLKPANILVDTEGVPHILDFGLARIVDPGMEVTRSLLGAETLVGTLPYMSPEQAGTGETDIDTRTDVYSLGVIFYQMLTGRYPYEVVGQLADVLRNIAEAEPARPSSIQHRINGEVETIVLRALAKDRERRYPSAEALGEDVRRYLDGEPIEAKRDSGWYVLRKLAARHRYTSAVLTALAVIILSFGIVSWFMYRQARFAYAQQTLSEEYARIAHKDMAGFLERGSRVFRQQGLGWFLLEWHEGRFDRAREIQAQLNPDSPEFAAMTFLLDKTQTAEDLERYTPQDAVAMVYFVSGERELKNGRTDQAIRDFERSAAATQPQYEWFRESAKARLRQLRDRPAGLSEAAPDARKGERDAR